MKRKPLTCAHKKRISDGLKLFYAGKETAKFVKTKKGPRMELKQKKAVLLSLLRKREREGSTKALEHELDKIGSDVRKLNKKLKKK